MHRAFFYCALFASWCLLPIASAQAPVAPTSTDTALSVLACGVTLVLFIVGIWLAVKAWRERIPSPEQIALIRELERNPLPSEAEQLQFVAASRRPKRGGGNSSAAAD